MDAGAGADLVVIGRLGRPHGLHGELAVRPTGPTLAVLEPGAEVVARTAGGERALRLLGRRGSGERPIIAFAGVETREQAAELAGAPVLVRAERLPALDDPDALYVRDLIGFEVLVGERPLGAVTQVHPAPANDVIEVATPAGPVLVPFTRDAVAALDLTARTLVIRPGLLPEPAAEEAPG